MPLNDYESAAVRRWAVDHAHKINRSRIPSIHEILDDAKVIEQYLRGGKPADLKTIAGKNGHRK